jgi:uncharacterized protein YbbC (DUF1343 family)
MVQTGLEIILAKFPAELKKKRIGLLCHAPSITPDFRHITELFYTRRDCTLSAIFGPQHGLYGETQDNMIEWSGQQLHPRYKIPVFSLYGEHRKPTARMLDEIDALVVDLQDVGARLYTYVWTVKLCMEACAAESIPVWILDRPNPVAGLDFDGPVLKREFFTFVGGASIPLCHRMTIGEIARWIQETELPDCNLRVIGMQNWKRSMMYNNTGLPWVIPSPNMPTLQTAIVYPGMVLFEALNVSEGRGTTIPFELFGSPFIKPYTLLKNIEIRNISGCIFRMHNFIPTFNKYIGETCYGLQLHITDLKNFRPVATAVEIIDAIISTSGPGAVRFNDPPYEYEYNLMPFDILSGDDLLRKVLSEGKPVSLEIARWREEIESFRKEFSKISLYDE